MFINDIKKTTKENDNFRKVIQTGDWSQLVLMDIPVGEEIGEETHLGIDQIIFHIEGQGKAVLGKEATPFNKNDVLFVPAGTKHNIINSGKTPLKIFTVYSPPAHKAQTIHKTKAEAERAEIKESKRASIATLDVLENM